MSMLGAHTSRMEHTHRDDPDASAPQDASEMLASAGIGKAAVP